MPNYLTPEGLAKLKKELNYLKTVKRKEIAESIKHAASFGDRSENFAYQQAKEDQSFSEGRILELENIIRDVKVIKKEKTGKVQIGSIITIVSLNNKKMEKFQIVGPEEVDLKEGKISFESPLGQALLGKSQGERIKIEIPEGKVEYKVLEIE